MAKTLSHLQPQQIQILIRQLPLAAQVRLVQRLEGDTWGARFRNVVKRLRARAKSHPISDKEIRHICEDVRQRRYAQGRR